MLGSIKNVWKCVEVYGNVRHLQNFQDENGCSEMYRNA